MGPVSYQTIKLSRGKHQSPDQGACVMELASMLAGEPFSDQPASVCPVIGSFLRAYNDSIDDGRRQDLYGYAAKVVGSRAAEQVQQARVRRLTEWGLQQQRRRWTRLLPRRLRSLAWMPELDVIGPQVVRAIAQHDERSHAEALALIDELLRTDTPRSADPGGERDVPKVAATAGPEPRP